MYERLQVVTPRIFEEMFDEEGLKRTWAVRFLFGGLLMATLLLFLFLGWLFDEGQSEQKERCRKEPFDGLTGDKKKFGESKTNRASNQDDRQEKHPSSDRQEGKEQESMGQGKGDKRDASSEDKRSMDGKKDPASSYATSSGKKDTASETLKAEVKRSVEKEVRSSMAKDNVERASATSKKPSPPPQSPRSAARELVGNRLNSEQATKAAEKIICLRPYVSGQLSATLDQLWSFFDMNVAAGSRFDANDKVIQTLKAKLNRQRLLFHPDKNGHPEAEKTFKFLEQCHQRLTIYCVKKAGRSESMVDKTRREERELFEEQEKRRKQMEEFKAQEDKLAREEEEKVRKEENHRQRLEVMKQAKEGQERISRRNLQVKQHLGFFGVSCMPVVRGDEPCIDDQVECIGSLTLDLIGAKGLPPQMYMFETQAFAVASIGSQKFTSPKVAGCSPRWVCSFTFEVRRVDLSLRVTLFREAFGKGLSTAWGVTLLEDENLGHVDIPFLDLDEWSGCVIGRVVEPAAPNSVVPGEGMQLELKASLDWF